MRKNLVADVRGIASDAVRIVRTRLELLSIEFQEEKARVVRQVLVASGALFFSFFGMLLALAWLVLALPVEYRQAVIGCVGLAFLAAAASCAFWLSRNGGRTPFASTIDTLIRDEAAFRGGDD
ncbi:hypothetical protein BWI17_04030 [Betaproteobacteria bacterium GR16-43]|nr:hypothetical protein BWI17_04030 [Betaproteobacteria bacterium GR16-43]